MTFQVAQISKSRNLAMSRSQGTEVGGKADTLKYENQNTTRPWTRRLLEQDKNGESGLL